ncbi:MAG: hypothetical protein ACREIS_15190 [Nitrospiraceae bacterium]
MPALWSSQRLKYAALIAVLSLPPLIVFANACGQIHGRACGFLQLFALLFVIPPLVVSSIVAPSDASDRTFWMAFVGVNFLIVGALAYFGLSLFAVFRRSPGTR